MEKRQGIFRLDTTKVGLDSLGGVIDSSKIFVGDSTSRLKYFAYQPAYSPKTELIQRTSPLLLKDASMIKSEIKFDSTGLVIVTRTFAGTDISEPKLLSLEDYLAEISRRNQDIEFDKLVSEKFKGQTADDLEKLFEKITDITIPLPFKTETIFGPPTINLRINGTVDITASYESIKSDQLQLSNLTGDQNNINFKQDLQITAKGTVGDKLTIDADWNTQRTFDFENQLKLKYTGYPDEVISLIEAGNVSMDTKSSLIQSSQALFGVKGEFKLGPLTLTSIFSQKKSKKEEKTFSGGTSQQDFQLSVYDYSDNHYFLDTLYKSSFLDYYNNTTGQLTQKTINNQILHTDPSFEVWVQTLPTDGTKRPGVAITQLPEVTTVLYDTLINTEEITGIRFFGQFRKLNANEYYINPQAGFLSLNISLPENYVVGVTYVNKLGEKFGRNSIDVSQNNDTLILKMIKCANQNPESTPLAWELKMKNIYRLPVSKVVEDGFKLEVLYNNDNVFEPTINVGGSSINLLQVLGLDRYTGTTRVPPPDNIFDFLLGYTINTETGDIIFPTLRPFYDELRDAGLDTTYLFDELYTKRKNEAVTLPIATKYYIKGSAKGESGISNTINLGFNVVQGSVKVYDGATQLTENVDYTVDYSSGVVVIRNPQALISSGLKITYDMNDLFSLASKTFIGARADYMMGENTNFGLTFVNLKQETLNDKVRIGEEPTNNSMFGVDFNTELKPKFLTNLVNLLPGYNTKEESVFNFRSEFALITPDPNTKKSRIPQDNGEAIAYIDDMEGAKKILSIGTTYASWTISSHPVDSSIGTNTELRQGKRGKMKWYNLQNAIRIKDVYPARDVQPGQDYLTPFFMDFNPNQRATYNYYQRGFDTTVKTTNWNGIMKFLNTTSTDLLNENINYIEFNMKIENINNIDLSQAKLLIDLGQISEDAIPNGLLDTEDSLANGQLDPIEDIGLDFMTDLQELAKFNEINDTNLTLADFPPYQDPAGDNNSKVQVINIDVINGTQNNSLFEGGNRPDTEDLNFNGALNVANAYFEYEVSLDTTNNEKISGQGAPGSGWFQYRVPLTEFVKIVNNPSLNYVDYIRIWIKGVSQEVRLVMVDLNLVGSQWIKSNKTDSSYNVSVVSIEENAQIYMSPVGGDLLRQTVRNTSGADTKSNEQSLSIDYTNLVSGERKTAIRDYRTQTLDIFNYKEMKLFVNGDPTLNYTNEVTYDATMIIRFGTDTNNYYEYRAPVHPDIRPGQPWDGYNEVKIIFADLTSLKVSRDSVNEVVEKPVPNGPPGSYYRIKGNPSLSTIRQFELGIEKNKTGPNSVISGSIWFNEIRVLKANDNNGYAYNINASVKMADFANISFNYSQIDPNFHSIETRAGTRNTGIQWDVGFSTNMHKILNNAFASLFSNKWKDFLNMPLTYRHSENITKPEYYPGSDIELEKAAEEEYKQVLAATNNEELARQMADNIINEARTIYAKDEFSVTGMNLNFPSNNYVVKTIVNAISMNFNAMNSSYRDYTYQRKTEFNYNGSININTDFGLATKLNLDINKLINLGDEYQNAKIYLFIPSLPFLPIFSDKFSASTDFTRTRSEQRQRSLAFDDPTSRYFRSNRGFNFNWKFIENWIIDLTGNYNVKIGSDLVGFETVGLDSSNNRQRTGSEILKEIFFNNSFVNFGKDLDYQQNTVFNPKFNIPLVKKYFDLNLSYNVTYGWINPNTTADIGYNVGYSNNITSSANFRLGEVLKVFEGSPDKNEPESPSGQSHPSNGPLKIADNGGTDLLKILRSLIPDNITVNFTQANTVANNGVIGRPGFTNFWFNFLSKEDYGPTQWYQLGFKMDPGRRVGGLLVTDQYNQTNNVTFSAMLSPIIPDNIRVNLSFTKSFGFNNNSQYTSGMDGREKIDPNMSSSSTNGYSIFFIGDIEDFKYESSTNSEENIKKIASNFKDQISSFPFPNWNLTISGLERFPLFSEFTTSVTLENTFTSEYKEALGTDYKGVVLTNSQMVTQAFNPLLGLNITFKEAFGGSLTANVRFNKSVSNSLSPSSSLIQAINTSDWLINVNFAKSGFEIPLFGLSLKNDISFSLSISKNINEPIDYRFYSNSPEPERIPGNGSTITTINPSIQYSLSSKVQLQVFYKYVRTEPLQETLTTIPRTQNQGGLNVRVSIN
ncbi:MAG: cell surface protein SprA [Ignavibacteria bacterium]|nr:cell surface protein SprA [Ignavibacteria bacterium]